ncbi:DUF262 domain-containing protein [Pectobacterium aquaticum]|uniref:DUF262 domain-containing protein n=1 Tax=Pectobacterium aquaticum TaxID=2204145 RepID=UPI000E2847F6|nr:DUF262 domain-containing protein [Pectobacterium aquaticum]RRO03715.1 DUF262 domain-containing protein [Pectobacterium aquaticum]
MAFVEPISIKDAVDKVSKNKYLLPAIQREFVWSTSQIEKLFDSLMRGYPISSFLFWEVDKKNINNYQFYEFIKTYHERDNIHNPKANIEDDSDIIAILDGQQRLTSLYIGLKGTYAYKLPRMRWENNAAFPKRKLCLNLLSSTVDGGLEYEFRFLTKDEYSKNKEGFFWFVVGDILKLQEAADVNDFLIESGISENNRDGFRQANKILFKLYEVIHKNKSINFFLEKDESLDKVLNIFIRVNSGGTKLSYSDLLLSIATAQWKEKDAREEITYFVDEINNIGDGFSFNKDFVLKSCLVLSDFKDIAFKVDNFNQENMFVIEKRWDEIKNAIESAVLLLNGFGYHRDTLTSNNALIPISYYLLKIGNPSGFIESRKYQRDRDNILKWLIMVILKRTFSGQSDNVLKSIRDVIDGDLDEFPLSEIIKKLKGTAKSISFDDEDIENLLYSKYSHVYTFSALACIYPSLDFRNKFHQDHIFPKTLFTQKKLRKNGLSEDDINYCLDNYNYLANLQLIEGVPNKEKSGKEFDVWIKEKYPNKNDRLSYMEKNYIPNMDFSLANFPKFIEAREQLIFSAFKKLLG